MSYIISAIAFIIIFSALILIHEFGHFIMARRAKIKVREFGIGLPPRAMKLFKKWDTLFSLNWIPFGGFVDLLGADDREGKYAKHPGSFQNKSLWERTKVICAGVFMNFMLAIFLLMIGFMAGMEPIMVNMEDIYKNIQDKRITVQEFAVIKTLDEDSVLYKGGLRPYDQIISINEEQYNLNDEIDQQQNEQGDLDFKILRDDEVLEISISLGDWYESDLGLEFFAVRSLPVLKIYEINETSVLNDIFKKDDLLLAVDGMPAFSRSELITKLSDKKRSTVTVLRNNQVLDLNFVNPFSGVVVAALDPKRSAYEAGLKEGDLISKINNHSVSNFVDVKSLIKAKESNDLEIVRGKEHLQFTVDSDDQGQLGVYLGKLDNWQFAAFTSQPKYINFSIIDSEPIAWYKAPFEAFSETIRLAGLTVEMLGDMVTKLVSSFSVPDGVAGPVGIAKITYISAQQGLLALIRLAAILSLSLAVINIMPFPALDGGRMVFIIYELFTGRKANQKVETVTHFVGFLFVLLLIIAVTYNDIVKLFTG